MSTGIAPLAARPGETSAGRFNWLILLSETRTLRSQQLAFRQVPPTLKSYHKKVVVKNKKTAETGGSLFFLVKMIGLAPLAARPGKQSTGLFG